MQITSEMIAAGVDALLAFDKEWDDPREAVARLLRASLGAAPSRERTACSAGSPEAVSPPRPTAPRR